MLGNWTGQKNSTEFVHISYRSIDALTMLRVDKNGVNSPLPISEIQTLIETGYLYPFVNEAIEKPDKIPFHIARYYARAALPWQIQN